MRERSGRSGTSGRASATIAGLVGAMLTLTLAATVKGQDSAGVFVVGTGGEGLRVVAAPGDFRRAAHPSWSPDGSMLAFSAFDATGRKSEIRIVSVEGGPSRSLAEGVAPSWSADGSRIAYVSSGKPAFATDWTRPGRNDERIEIVSLDGLGAVEVVASGLWPRWAPTDDRLAFASRRGATWDVYVRSADGLGQLRLTDDPAMDTEPRWSPDGLEVVFLSNRGVRWDLYRTLADGKGPVLRLTNHPTREDGAALSPDATRVAFTDRQDRSGSRILVLDLASEVIHPLLPDSIGDRDPAWSPDGRRIAFVSRRP